MKTENAQIKDLNLSLQYGQLLYFRLCQSNSDTVSLMKKLFPKGQVTKVQIFENLLFPHCPLTDKNTDKHITHGGYSFCFSSSRGVKHTGFKL